MRKIDPKTAPTGSGTRYPALYAEACKRRSWLRLGDAAGLTQFGANLVRLAPGVWSSQRHWHALEDEFVYLLEGELVLVTDEGDETLRAGDSAGFPAGVPNGHHLQNRSAADAVLLVVGSRKDDDHAEYPDIDMRSNPGRYKGGGGFTRKDGSSF